MVSSLRHRIWIFSALVGWLVMSTPTCLVAETPLDPEGDLRYDKVLIDVRVERSGLEERQAALKEARTQGLQLWLDTQIDSLDPDTASRFVAAADEYVVSTDIVGEAPVTLGRQLSVAVFVDRERLRFDVASHLFPLRKTPARAVVILGEELVGVPGYTVAQDGGGTAMLNSFFDGQQLQSIAPSEITRLYSHDDLVRCLREGVKAGGRLGRALKADVVFLGEARTELIGDPEQPTFQVRAFVDAMVVLSKNGSLLDRVEAEAVVSGTDVAVASNRALKDAVYKVQQRLLVAAALGLVDGGVADVTRLVVRSDNIRMAEAHVSEFLKRNEAITFAELLHRGRDELVYDIAFEGKLGALVRSLEEPVDSAIHFIPVQVVSDEMVFDLAVQP
jgi:hypothetical protein